MGVTETLNAYPTYIIAYLSLIHCLSPANGSKYQNPRHLKKDERNLKQKQRQLSRKKDQTANKRRFR